MAERVVSVKMPSTLVQELRRLTAQNHYLDLSEQLRSVVRQKAVKYTTPYDDIQQLRSQIEEQIRTANSQMKKEQILQELARLLREEGR